MRDLAKLKEKVVIRLDNRQVALAIIGFIVVSIGTFAGGVVVGKQMSDGVPDSIDELAGADGDLDLDSASEHRSRSELLTQVTPGTRDIHTNLSGPAAEIRATSPTEAARIETHRQIAQARRGVTRSLGPVAVGPLKPAAKRTEPVTMVQRNPAKEKAAMDQAAKVASSFALQVSAFSTPGPAQVVAEELKRSGHAARVRAVQGDTGSQLFRVEVGRFADARAATRFQRSFEKESGYSTVMVPVR